MNYWIDTTRLFPPGERDSFPLIHMTQNWDILRLILKEGLRPSYCRENVTNDYENKSACFPMISTSNVSIDFAIDYQRSYGTLGIVLDKAWGEINDFNPVLYLERKSDLTNEIIEGFKSISAASIEDIQSAVNGTTTDHKSLMTKQLVKIFAHSKNYDGELVRNERLLAEKYPYGMEREWRKIIKVDYAPYFIVGHDIEKKKDFNDLIKEVRIDYKLEHLRAVIVEDYDQQDVVKDIICKKFDLNEFPKEIKIKVNTIRHVPDE
ncbi:Putative abortive phage resistance protein AbiGi, antitoxin [Pedobacter terrae]|uniref:Putative abortive phage resistance protein AbiGi, antitoxin n=1 Tax=Pedobacter terrae TaxID=405671 RepID=A0A1G7QBD5_9SPHI|nr:abortive infection system antitoxin AbiGi family protein [Pedobacter terrae]SDF95897.1 Putative abortive phage resistance protein AbiGi, antitoxin [Pedobacter terrae]